MNGMTSRGIPNHSTEITIKNRSGFLLDRSIYVNGCVLIVVLCCAEKLQL